MSRQVNQQTFDLIKKWEGYETALKNGGCMAYLDIQANKRSWSPGYSGLWTIGFGSTGPSITQGTIWTRAQAEAALRDEVNAKAAEVQAYVTYPLNDNQFGALVSLAYNVGTGGIHGILNLINSGDLEGAANAFTNYDHVDGEVVQGLLNRRIDEKELFEWETPSQVAKLSPEYNATQVGQQVTAASMFGGYLTWDNLAQVRQFMSDHNGMILLGAGAVIFILMNVFGNRIISAFNAGTYVPPGTIPPPAQLPPPTPVTAKV